MQRTIMTIAVIGVTSALVGVIAAPAHAHNNNWEHKPCQEKPSSPTSPPSAPPSQQPPAPSSPPVAPTGPVPPAAPAPMPPTPTTPSAPPSTVTPPCEVCQSRRTFTIRLAKRSSHGVRSARVYYTGHTRHGVRLHKRASDGRWVARITFYGHKYFPGQQEVIAIRVRYRDGHRAGDFRLYRPCQPKLGMLNEPWRV